VIYDVIIIGCGVIGASIARYLSRFNCSILVLEKHNDVGEETSSANSAIVHSGYDPKPNTLKAKFNVLGNKMMDQVASELDVPFFRNGSLTLAFKGDEKQIEELLYRAKENGVEARYIYKEELIKMEPNVNKEAIGALYCPSAGIINSFLLTVGFIENAMDNGVNLMLNSEVVDIKYIDNLYHLKVGNKEYISKTLINASGQNSANLHSKLENPNYEIIHKKGQYILLDHFDDNFIKHTLFLCPTKVGKGVLVAKTTSNNYFIGPSNELTAMNDTSTSSLTFSYLKEEANKLVTNIPYNEVIREFSGVRANSSVDDFIIEESKNYPLFFEVGGIMSPGLASSPAIGEYVANLVKNRLNLSLNLNYNPFIRKHYSFKNLSEVEFKELFKKNPLYSKIICRCEKISEGEIIDVINRNCGATTVKGVKKRVRAGFGKCQGTFCQEEVIRILARELNKPINEILYSELGTEILKYNAKEKYEG